MWARGLEFMLRLALFRGDDMGASSLMFFLSKVCSVGSAVFYCIPDLLQSERILSVVDTGVRW